MIETEKINKNTENIDLVPTIEMVKMINDEDLQVAQAVNKCLDKVADAVDIIAGNFSSGGRLFYFGAGTSGRLGVLDASECPPTFSSPSSMVNGIIAGGDRALRFAIEGAEDSEELACKDLAECSLCVNDTVVAVSASGNAKYVVKVLKEAKNIGCKTIGVCCNPLASMKEYADVFICAQTGAEVISGSTRMKAGTAQKMILNMLTTASMIKIGKTFHNLMIDVNPTNQKLKRRAVLIVCEICGCSQSVAKDVLENNNYKIKHAVLNVKYGLDFDAADRLLAQYNGVLRKVFLHLEN